MEEDDPVVEEMDVYLSQCSHLYLLQYPLHPSHMPYPSEGILSARVRGEGEGLGVELDVKVRPRGENYSQSQGSRLASKDSSAGGGGLLGSENLFDQVTLTSKPTPPNKTQRYAVATVKNGALHITPVQGMVQLRPSLSYLDKADIDAKKADVAASRSADGGDTTESEGEEAKPVTVSFAKQRNIARSQAKKVGHRATFTEAAEKKKEDLWTKLTYFGTDTEEADEERRLLLANKEDQQWQFTLTEEQYLDAIFPKGMTGEEEGGDGASGLPRGVMSLEQIRKLPLRQQVLEVLSKSHVIQFSELCSLLGVSGAKVGGVLQAVQECGVLVQGCWVLASHVTFPQQEQAAERNARDYILWCFCQKRFVHRKDVIGVVKLPNKEVMEIMRPIADNKVAPQQGWEFKLQQDSEFLSRNAGMVQKEKERWTKRHSELVREVHLKSPAAAKPPVTQSKDTPLSSSHPAGTSGSGSGGKGLGKAQKKPKGKDSSKDSDAAEGGDTAASKLSLTPSRHTSAASLVPQAIPMTTDIISMDTPSVTTVPEAVPMVTDAVDTGINMVSQATHVTKGSVSMDTGPLSINTDSVPMDTNAIPVAMNVQTDTVPMDTLPTGVAREVAIPSNDEAAGFKSPVKIERPDTPPPPPILLSPAEPVPGSSSSGCVMNMPIKQEKLNPELSDTLVSFLCETLGRSVLSFGDVRDRLLLKQMSAEPGHLLREGGVSDAQLEAGLRLCGAMEVGQSQGRRMFALTHNNECRNAILEVFQVKECVRKKEVSDVLKTRNIVVPDKILLKALKELCYGRGGHWKLLGT